MGIFDNLTGANPSGGGRYFTPGRYIVDITRIEFKQGFKGESIVIEAQVVAGQPVPDSVNAQTGKPHSPPQPGQTAAHVISASGSKEKMAKDNWMAFLLAVYQCEQAAYTDEQWSDISGKATQGALNGQRLLLDVWEKPQKANPDKVFTVHKWMRPATPEDLQEFGVSAA
jgi:hypothetical protein